MAQSGFTPILCYASGTATNVPLAANLTSSASGAELALNYADGKLYFKNSSGVVTLLASSATVAPVTTLSFGTTGLTPSTATSGAITVAGTLATTNGGTGLTSFTANRVFYASSTSAISQSANLTFDGTTLVAANFTDSSLTSGRVTYATTGGNLTDSANLLFDGTTLTANALTTTSTVTINGGTANGVAYLNGSKVLTTGSALTFDGTKFGVASGNIDVVSASFVGSPLIAARFNASNFRMGIGIGNSNGFPFLGANVNNAANDNGTFDINGYASRIRLDNGVFQVQTSSASGTAGNAITWNTPLYLDSSGNLGIGTSSPSAKLQVNSGDIRIVQTNNSANNGLYFRNSADSGTYAKVAYVAATGELQVGTTDAYSLLLQTNNTTKATLDSSGNLGLGVTPSAWGMSGANKAFQNLGGAFYSLNTQNLVLSQNSFYNGTNDRYVTTDVASKYQQSAGSHVWFTAPSGTAGNAITFTQAMTLDASGNLGIGTTGPQDKLDVVSSSSAFLNRVRNTGANQAAFLFQNSTTGTLPTDGLFVGIGADTVGYVYQYENQPLVFGTNNTERARITSGGDLYVGQTTAGLQAARSFSWQGVGDGSFYVSHSTANASGDPYMRFGYNATQIGTITQNGTTAVAYNTSSDYRLKNITGPITTSGAYIDSLNPVEGTWKADGSIFVGLIAHEVQEASRTPVATGVKDGEEMQGMDYSSAEIIANLIAEVKSLRARVAQLESKGA